MAAEQSTTTDLVIAGITILQDRHGRYNLNKFHEASRSAESKSPGQWLKRKSTQALITELDSQMSYSPFDVVKGGNVAGTYVHELLAVSYAGWISPAFQLKVNQAFLDMRDGTEPHTLSDPLERYPELRAIRELLVTTAEARDEAALARQEAQAAEVRAERAETKADLALEDSRYLAVEEFVMKNGLLHQFPPSSYGRMSDWLKDFSRQYGLDIRKAPVYGKPWDDENTYMWQAFSAFLRYEQKRPRQITLVKEAEIPPA